MISQRMTAVIVGSLFIIAMVSSLIGGGMLETIFNAPDFPGQLTGQAVPISVGVLLEVINAVAVLGIAFLLYPIIRRDDDTMAISYAGLRILESFFCMLAALFPMVLVEISQNGVPAGGVGTPWLEAFSSMLLAARGVATGVFIPLLFGLSALVFYTFLYRTRLLPRFIAIWGLGAVVLMFVVNLANFSLIVGMIFALPIILNEIFLGFWLIFRGFSIPEPSAEA